MTIAPVYVYAYTCLYLLLLLRAQLHCRLGGGVHRAQATVHYLHVHQGALAIVIAYMCACVFGFVNSACVCGQASEDPSFKPGPKADGDKLLNIDSAVSTDHARIDMDPETGGSAGFIIRSSLA
jgi:hypothetical protein